MESDEQLLNEINELLTINGIPTVSPPTSQTSIPIPLRMIIDDTVNELESQLPTVVNELESQLPTVVNESQTKTELIINNFKIVSPIFTGFMIGSTGFLFNPFIGAITSIGGVVIANLLTKKLQKTKI